MKFVSICSISSNRYVFGAGSENRTRATRSEAWDSTTKLYPHKLIILYNKIKKYAIIVYLSFSFFNKMKLR